MSRRRGRTAPAQNAIVQNAIATPVAQVAQEAAALEIMIDTSSLKMGDLRLLGQLRQGRGSDEDALEFLNRVVVGGVDDLPLDAQPEIWAAVWQTVYGRGARAKN
jgi:hypothetical protein